MSDISDVYQRVTDQIVAALEAGVKAGDWSCPWNSGRATAAPVNAQSGRCYRGVNVLALWAAAEAGAYETGVWATYKQWGELGAQVRKGEKATCLVFWKQLAAAARDEGTEGDEAGQPGRVRMMARAFFVFNAGQVDGYAGRGMPVVSDIERDAAAEDWFAAVPATVVHGGARACYVPSQDLVMMPAFRTFVEPVAYYSVLAHELTHWSGAKGRLDRDMSGRFGDQGYAMEELVAELGAAFVCCTLGLSAVARQDHAAYIAGWLRVLKSDKRAIFTAAARAQRAADYLAETRAARQAFATHCAR